VLAALESPLLHITLHAGGDEARPDAGMMAGILVTTRQSMCRVDRFPTPFQIARSECRIPASTSRTSPRPPVAEQHHTDAIGSPTEWEAVMI
jgi:hypothetical protein